jgi:polar amino acid transport system permease protein
MSGDQLAEPTITPQHASPTSARNVRVVPLRHPWRWAAAVVVLLFVVWVARVLITTKAFEWSVVGHYLFTSAVLAGVLHTLEMTALAMLIGIVLGTIIAVMRLSSNPILTGVAGFYQWFFRGTPTLVQLIFWFNLSSVFPRIKLHIGGLVLTNFDTNHLMTPFVAALLGLGLNFAAYYSEIVRAGILSVDEGQTDAATAYGLTRLQTLRHIILPQAMRVIIPPTGNETIGMLKWTSLASIVSYSELLQTVTVVYNRTYQVIPLLIVAVLWYLFLTTVLSIGQSFIEKRFARGAERNPRQSPIYALLVGLLRRVRTR